MNIKSRSGVTLVEILIGFLLIGSASVIFFQTMHRFRKETAFTTENFLASSLVEKVLEQCYQETELNPYGLEAIGLADKNGKPYNISTYVTDKETVFFARPAITEKATPELYDVLKDNFNLNVTSEKKAGYYELTAGFEWNAKTGNGQAFANTRILSFTGEKEVITTFSLSEDEVRKKIVEDIFNSPGAALETKISSIGAQKLVLSAGYIYYSCVGWLNSDEFKNKLQQKPTLDVPGMTEFQLNENTSLGLMPVAGIRRLLGEKLPDPDKASGIPRAEIYLSIGNPEAFHQRALENGATELSPLSLRGWGDEAAYSMDKDGHVLVFARSKG
jgi:hypothetical protein